MYQPVRSIMALTRPMLSSQLPLRHLIPLTPVISRLSFGSIGKPLIKASPKDEAPEAPAKTWEEEKKYFRLTEKSMEVIDK
eukprot:Ihof_evm3s529 gene=Ihof_evmTU3s529